LSRLLSLCPPCFASSWGMGGDGKQWMCKYCYGSDGKPWRNRGEHMACRVCRRPKCSAHIVVSGAGAKSGGGRGQAPAVSRAPRNGAAATCNPSVAKPPKSAAKEVQQLKAEVAALRKQVATAPTVLPKGEAQKKEEEEAIVKLRADISKLEAVASLLPEGLLDGKRAALAKMLDDKRAARPLEARLREVQDTVARRQKAVEKQQTTIASLKKQLEEVAKTLQEAEAEEVVLAAKLDEIVAVQVELFRQRTVEAAVAAKVDIVANPPPVQVLEQMLQQAKGDDLPSGVTKEQLVTALGLIAQLVGKNMPASAGSSCAAAPPGEGIQGVKPADDDYFEDLDMEDPELIGSFAVEDREAFKMVRARLQEKGIGLKGKKGLVRKEKK